MCKPVWQIVFMLLCHLNEQKGDCDQGNDIIIKLTEARCASQIFNAIIVSLISEVEFLLEDFLYG